MWFSFDGDNFEIHETESAAKALARLAMDEYRCDAGDGWCEESLRVCWGKVSEHAEVTMSRERTDEDDAMIAPGIDTVEERELVSLPIEISPGVRLLPCKEDTNGEWVPDID